mgnify:CR=1 FL=1
MSIKIIGALFVIVGCGGFGWKLAAIHRREVRILRELITLLDFMECELQFRLTPLPDLFRQAAQESRSVLRSVFSQINYTPKDV